MFMAAAWRQVEKQMLTRDSHLENTLMIGHYFQK